jgi:hypothetical protein
MIEEEARFTVREDIVLEKFEGEPEDGVLLERVHLTDGVITKHEYFEDGELVKVEKKEVDSNGTN